MPDAERLACQSNALEIPLFMTILEKGNRGIFEVTRIRLAPKMPIPARPNLSFNGYLITPKITERKHDTLMLYCQVFIAPFLKYNTLLLYKYR